MSRLLTVLLLFLASAASVRAGPLEDAAREVGAPLIVRFGLERCLQCIKQAEAFAELQPKYAERMTFRFVHIGEQEEMAGQYRVLLIPTVLFFDGTGNEVFRHVGYLSSAQLEAQFVRAGFPGAAAGR